jgi:hypothetical protein
MRAAFAEEGPRGTAGDMPGMEKRGTAWRRVSKRDVEVDAVVSMADGPDPGTGAGGRDGIASSRRAMPRNASVRGMNRGMDIVAHPWLGYLPFLGADCAGVSLTAGRRGKGALREGDPEALVDRSSRSSRRSARQAGFRFPSAWRLSFMAIP